MGENGTEKEEKRTWKLDEESFVLVGADKVEVANDCRVSNSFDVLLKEEKEVRTIG